MNTHILLNGEFHKAGTPVITAENRAFRYADGFFETIRAYGSTPLLFDYHWERITKTAKHLHLTFDPEHTREYFVRKIESILKKNKLFNGARVRITFFREGEGLYTPVRHETGYLLETTPLDSDNYPLNKKGLSVDLYPENKKCLNSWSNLKLLNAVLYTQAGIYKTKKSLNDCILLNENGFLCESISSNLFIYENQALYTPPLTDGCIDGIMRKKVIELAENRGIKTIDNLSLTIDHLLQAEEIFLTNAIQGIQWVGAMRNKRYFHFLASKLHAQLNDWVFIDWKK